MFRLGTGSLGGCDGLDVLLGWEWEEMHAEFYWTELLEDRDGV